MVLLLEAAPVGWAGNFVANSWSGYGHYKKTIEAAGHAYQLLLRRSSGETIETIVVEKTVEIEDDAVSTEERAQYESKRHKKIATSEDHYEVLGLGDRRWRASLDEIKKAHKQLVLQYHPDKNVGISDDIFKKITKAYETLTDPKKRRTFDSQEPFDDALPSNSEVEANFWAVMTDAFERFGRWSANPAVPALGDDNTPMNQVNKFYEFWFSFKSWRDWSFEDEFDPTEAESRDERRWMERQNEKTRKKYKKEESAQILRLAELAERFDPRLRRQREAAQKEKDQKKAAKQQESRKRREEQERKESEEKARVEAQQKKKAEEDAIAQKKKKADAEKLRKSRSKFRTLAATLPGVSQKDIEILCSLLPLQKIVDLLQFCQSDPTNAPAVIQEDVKMCEEEERIRKSGGNKNANSGEEKSKPWTDEELSMLAKAIQKFPGGVPNRWELVAEFIGTRSVKDVINKSKEANRTVAHKPALAEFESDYEKSTKAKKATPEIKAEASQPIADVIPSSDTPSQTPSAPSSTQNGSKKPVAQPTKSSKQPAAKSAVPAAQPTAPAVPAVEETQVPAKTEEPFVGMREWTSEEQKRLEKALATTPSTNPERWDIVAKTVGRSKKDCVMRYKHLVAQIKQKKSGGA